MHSSTKSRSVMATLVAIIFLGAIAGCATTMDSGSHCTVEEGFLRAQRTFAWSEEGAVDLIDESGYVSPAIIERLKKSVIRELGLKGFRWIESPSVENPVDMTVQIYLRTRREVVSTTAYGRSRGPCVYPNCEQATRTNGLPINIQTTGFLAADVFYQGEAIWRGWIERLLYPSDRDEAEAIITEAVPKLFEKLPQ